MLVFSTVSLMLWLLMLYRQYRLRKDEENRQAMFALVSQILGK